MHDLQKIFSGFDIDGAFVDATPYGSGHINDTFLVSCREKSTDRRYIFQRINHSIFKNPPQLMENISRVTGHIRAGLEREGAEDIDRRVLTVIPARNQKDYQQDAKGNYWRAYHFIDRARTYDVLENLDQAREAARAFGAFQGRLADLPSPPLFETIPDFHNGLKRMDAFQQALRSDACNRAAKAKKEVDFVLDHASMFEVFPRQIQSGRLPVRTTHNDTKINNVMIDDQTNEGICVIDLDTVMPGLALYDVGDIMRTTLSPAAEDERDLSKVFIEMPRLEAILDGYLSSAGAFLTETEKQHLVFAGQMITLIIGTRFLTDYLAGDIYFKVHREGHNLDRCRTQLRLAASMMEHRDAMEQLVEKYSSGSAL